MLVVDISVQQEKLQGLKVLQRKKYADISRDTKRESNKRESTVIVSVAH